MRKGSTRKPQDDTPAVHVKNYITPGGLERLKEEHQFLLNKDRPAVAVVVAWAASNGDRSETPTIDRPGAISGKSTGGFAIFPGMGAAEVADPEAPRSNLKATKGVEQEGEARSQPLTTAKRLTRPL